MNLLKSFVIAFSMYSRIPMPRLEWNKQSMRYSMAFFPLIGVVIGGLSLLVWWLCRLLGFGVLLQSALLCALPVAVTGGIHLDGYCDTVDALSSRQPRERKLEILKDPHTGAFAVLFCCVYFLLQFGLYTEIATVWQMLLTGLGFVLSRGCSVAALLTFRSAKRSGTLYLFSSRAQRRGVLISACCYIAATLFCSAMINIVTMLIIAAAVLLLFGYYRWMSYRQFGGVTGDLAGWFLQVCELGILAAVVLSSKIGGA